MFGVVSHVSRVRKDGSQESESVFIGLHVVGPLFGVLQLFDLLELFMPSLLIQSCCSPLYGSDHKSSQCDCIWGALADLWRRRCTVT